MGVCKMNLLENESIITKDDLLRYSRVKEISIDVDSLEDLLFGMLEDQYQSMTVTQLKEYAKALNLAIPSSFKKDDIVECIFDYFQNYNSNTNFIFDNNTLCFQTEIEKDKVDSITESSNSFIEKLSEYNDKDTDNKVMIKVLESVDVLKEYIKRCISLESDIYYLKERLIKLESLKYENSQNIKKAKGLINHSLKEITDRKLFEVNTIIDILDYKIVSAEYYVDKDSLNIACDLPKPVPPMKPNIMQPMEPSYPILKRVGLLNKKNDIEYNNRLISNYEKEMEKYKYDLKVYNSILQQYQIGMDIYKRNVDKYENEYRKAQKAAVKEEAKKIINEVQKEIRVQKQRASKLEKQKDDKSIVSKWIDTIPQQTIKTLLDGEIKNTKNSIKKVMKAKNELYSYNVIYKKYRNLIALSSIYEYLDSGRCDALVGAHGAYNLFEKEARANEIIIKLNVIIKSLEKIRTNQYILYSELKQVNDNLQTINKSLSDVIDEISQINTNLEKNNSYIEIIKNIEAGIFEASLSTAKSTKEIKHNTSITAYYSRLTSENTKRITSINDSLGFIVGLKK